MAGKHVPVSSLRTLVTAVGVHGLLMASRLSLVQCALVSFPESERTRSGSGGFSTGCTEVDTDGVRDAENWVKSASVDVIKSLRARVSPSFDAAILFLTPYRKEAVGRTIKR